MAGLTAEDLIGSLFRALDRESAAIADNIGLPLTGEQLKIVKHRVVFSFIMKSVAPSLSLAEVISTYRKEQDVVPSD